MHKLSTLFILSLLLTGCSDDITEPEQQIQVTQSAQTRGELTEEEFAIPLNTPITDVATGRNSEEPTRDDIPDNVTELEWDELMPKDYRIEEILVQINAGELSDDDPRVEEAMEKIKELYSKAPVVEELDNKMVKLPGFVVPLNMDGKKTTDFLLVPYYGACIHVPPPPSNQTVFVTGHNSELKLYDTVWVIGNLKVKKIENELGDSGYSIQDAIVKPYE